jgi:integrase
MILETGMRPSEVARITKVNVHLKDGYVYNPFGKRKRKAQDTTLRQGGAGYATE